MLGHKKKWRKLIGVLRRMYPPAGKVRVVRRLRKGLYGTTTMESNGDFVIHVSPACDWTSQVETLLHEWAHMLAIEKSYGHSEQWCKNYSVLYNAMEEGDFSQCNTKIKNSSRKKC